MHCKNLQLLLSQNAQPTPGSDSSTDSGVNLKGENEDEGHLLQLTEDGQRNLLIVEAL